MIPTIPPSISDIQLELAQLLGSGLLVPMPESIESMELAIQMTAESLYVAAL